MSILEALRIRGFLKTAGMITVGKSLRVNGFRKTMALYGWRIFAVVFVCYLIRDVVLYILLPWWVAHAFVK